MNARWDLGRWAARWLLALLLALGLAGAVRIAWAAEGAGSPRPSATALPEEWSAHPSVAGQTLVEAPLPPNMVLAPDQTAETWTNPVFWIVLALVVLGSLVLMADFPETN